VTTHQQPRPQGDMTFLVTEAEDLLLGTSETTSEASASDWIHRYTELVTNLVMYLVLYYLVTSLVSSNQFSFILNYFLV
jgi:flavin-binding protein dodecin